MEDSSCSGNWARAQGHSSELVPEFALISLTVSREQQKDGKL